MLKCTPIRTGALGIDSRGSNARMDGGDRGTGGTQNAGGDPTPTWVAPENAERWRAQMSEGEPRTIHGMDLFCGPSTSADARGLKKVPSIDEPHIGLCPKAGLVFISSAAAAGTRAPAPWPARASEGAPPPSAGSKGKKRGAGESGGTRHKRHERSHGFT